MSNSQKTKTITGNIGIVAIACEIPPDRETIGDILKNERIELSDSSKQALGFESVSSFKGTGKTDLAVIAARKCLQKSGYAASDIGAIIDFSVMPEEFVVPSWSISNKIQQELGAVNAANMGFGGNGTTNLLVALNYASALILTHEIKTAMLVAVDTAISGNRVIGGKAPLTVLGDGASAILVAENAGACEIVDIELSSNGDLHDVSFIPGGGLAFPIREDLYKFKIDQDKFNASKAWNGVKNKADILLHRQGVSYHEIAHVVFPSISEADTLLGCKTFNCGNADYFKNNGRFFGHIQATDLSLHLEQLIGRPRKLQDTEWTLIGSHGWGFTYGAMLIRWAA
jgi:3-oxoacyl-[acyl-carrier-protein] synthase III